MKTVNNLANAIVLYTLEDIHTQVQQFFVDTKRNLKEILISACYSPNNTRSSAAKEEEAQRRRNQEQRQKEQKQKRADNEERNTNQQKTEIAEKDQINKS